MLDYDAEDLDKERVVVVVVSTWSQGAAPADAKFFTEWLSAAPSDCRVNDQFLRPLRFGVFGVGDSAYADQGHFNRVGKALYGDLLLLGAARLMPLSVGDVSDSVDAAFSRWTAKLMPRIARAMEDEHYLVSQSRQPAQAKSTSKLTDVEDIGKVLGSEAKTHEAEEGAAESKGKAKPEMLSARQRASLVKQGYKVIGSHSGVKLCRWTKSMLRGRGGCYKHSFYGIKSYQCMELTPSLACANKCVFCWRHHTNPVGREWKWVQDPPDFILQKATQAHKQMVKQMRGVPGVIQARLAEAVGRINEFLQLLHAQHISTFLVTNAQFPAAIRAATDITQLYVSVDAATKDSLKAIDRPLFRDFWERLMESLECLRSKRQRTVYRLTLVKGWNAADIPEYARLIALGQPTFVEVKGVTFCGKSDASSLTMDNVPFHFEVLRFCQQLCGYLSSDYDIACEHEHSCCVLIARKELKVDGVWHTHIDYDRFFELVEQGTPFGYADYMAPTPQWALLHSEHRGFNPDEQRFRKKRNTTPLKQARLHHKIEAAKSRIESEKQLEQQVADEHNPYLKELERKEACEQKQCECAGSDTQVNCNWHMT